MKDSEGILKQVAKLTGVPCAVLSTDPFMPIRVSMGEGHDKVLPGYHDIPAVTIRSCQCEISQCILRDDDRWDAERVVIEALVNHFFTWNREYAILLHARDLALEILRMYRNAERMVIPLSIYDDWHLMPPWPAIEMKLATYVSEEAWFRVKDVVRSLESTTIWQFHQARWRDIPYFATLFAIQCHAHLPRHSELPYLGKAPYPAHLVAMGQDRTETPVNPPDVE